MTTKDINPETIWTETYKNEPIVTDNHSTISVFSAIHPDAGPLFRIELETSGNLIRLSSRADLTPEAAEKLANELLNGAQLMREHSVRWAEHEAKKHRLEAA
jgi:hypothetical protein